MPKIGFIGMGNMGYAILKGLLKTYKKEDIIFTDLDKDRMAQISMETEVECVEKNQECASMVKYLVLAVKPQFYDEVLQNIAYVMTPGHIVISIAPGITIADMQKNLGADIRVVRAMPNTPAMVGEGMTGVCYDENVMTKGEQDVIKNFFCSFGRMRKVEERLMNSVACASGSSPAYAYIFIEALADSAVRYGLSREEAYEFAAQTLLGSAKMVLETGEHPGRLKDMVCSPGGTTIAGVAALEEYGFRNAVMKATDACFAKCENIK